MASGTSTLTPPQRDLPLAVTALTNPSRLTATFAKSISLIFLLLIAGVLFLPWRQFVVGTGRVIAFNPLDRRSNVEAQVSGRVKHLHIVEGQRVKKGQVIVEIEDNDPNLINNLKAQREAIESRRDFAQSRVESLIAQITQQELAKGQAIDAAQQRVTATKATSDTARLNFDRTEKLFKQGLSSQRDFELATLGRDSALAELKSAEANLKRTSNDFDAAIASIHAQKGSALADVATAERDLSSLDITISQNQRQIVECPRDGIILQIAATDGTYLRPGSLICVIIPETESRYVEIWLDGNDMPLLHPRTESEGKIIPGSSVRLSFEGWPAVQIVGWPNLAVGTFGGEVIFVDAADDGKGKFRVVVAPLPDKVHRHGELVEVPWPDRNRWLRQGVRANAWIMLQEVPLWYEIWRQINGFPPATAMGDQKTDSKK
jgi:multidrug resistance efflux pump